VELLEEDRARERVEVRALGALGGVGKTWERRQTAHRTSERRVAAREGSQFCGGRQHGESMQAPRSAIQCARAIK
jgi:hypothetical protein